MSEALQQLRRAALGDVRLAVHDEILLEARRLNARPLEGHRDARVAPDVADLLMLRQVRGD